MESGLDAGGLAGVGRVTHEPMPAEISKPGIESNVRLKIGTSDSEDSEDSEDSTGDTDPADDITPLSPASTATATNVLFPNVTPIHC